MAGLMQGDNTASTDGRAVESMTRLLDADLRVRNLPITMCKFAL